MLYFSFYQGVFKMSLDVSHSQSFLLSFLISDEIYNNGSVEDFKSLSCVNGNFSKNTSPQNLIYKKIKSFLSEKISTCILSKFNSAQKISSLIDKGYSVSILTVDYSEGNVSVLQDIQTYKLTVNESSVDLFLYVGDEKSNSDMSMKFKFKDKDLIECSQSEAGFVSSRFLTDESLKPFLEGVERSTEVAFGCFNLVLAKEPRTGSSVVEVSVKELS